MPICDGGCQRARDCARAPGACLALVALSAAAAAPLARELQPERPVIWVSVAAGAAVAGLGRDGRRRLAQRRRRAQLPRAAPDRARSGARRLRRRRCWPTARRSSRCRRCGRRAQFSPPRWSGDGGATWQPGALAGSRRALRLRSRRRASSASTRSRADPTDPRTAWFCQGNLYVTHDAGRTWSVRAPRLKRPWHCAALAIAPGSRTRCSCWRSRRPRTPSASPAGCCAASTAARRGSQLKAPRSPQLDYNGHALAFDPVQPSTVLMIAANGATLGSLYRSIDAGLHWKRVRPGGALRGAVVDQFAFASDGRVLALLRIGDRQTRRVRARSTAASTGTPRRR